MSRLLVSLVMAGAMSALAQEVDAGVAAVDAGVDAGPAPTGLDATALTEGRAGLEPKQSAPPVESATNFYLDNFHGTYLQTGVPFVYEVSFIVGGGGYLHGVGLPTIPLTGVRVREYNGLLSFGLLALLGNVLQGLSMVNITDVRSSSSTNRVYNANGTATDVTTTTTTGKVTVNSTPEQLEKDQAALRQGIAGVTWIEMAVYADNFLGWNRGVTGGSGYELAAGGHGNLFFIGDMPVVLDVGLQLANIRVPSPPGSGSAEKYLYWASGGVMGRLHVPLARVAAIDLEWVLNFLSFDYLRGDDELREEGRLVSSPLKLGVEVYATDRIVVRGQAVLGGLGFTDGKLGLFLSAGVRL